MANEKDLVQLAVFLGATFAGGELACVLGVSPIVMYIAVGALLGPPLADFVPVPSGVMLAGLLGIQLSVVDAGLGTNLNDLRKSALRAGLVAILGVMFPIAGTCLVLCVMDVVEGNFETSRSLKTAFAAGSAIAPTSLGVTAQLLTEIGELNSRLGQLISIAAVFDDVISLVLLSEVIAVAGPEPNAWQLVQPVVFSIVFIVGALLFALLLPTVLRWVLLKTMIPERIQPKLGLYLLCVVIIVFTYLATLAKTSFLLAGYLTGVAFAQIPNRTALTPWKQHVGVYINWLSILFFAGTIGFVIPLKDLFSKSSLGIGALLATIAVLGKMLCGVGLLPNIADGLAVAVAMLGRGEFGFLIAAHARASGLLTDRIYAATTWGILVPTLLTPILFRPVFRWRKKRVDQQHSESYESTASQSERNLDPNCGIPSDSEPVVAIPGG